MDKSSQDIGPSEVKVPIPHEAPPHQCSGAPMGHDGAPSVAYIGGPSMGYVGLPPQVPMMPPPGAAEPPPTYENSNMLYGLDLLSTLSRVDINQRRITTKDGEVIFAVKRELVKSFFSATFYFDLYDTSGRKVVCLLPVRSGCSIRIQVHVGGQLLSELTKSSLLGCVPRYHVQDAAGRKAYKIYPPALADSNRFYLKIKDPSGQQVGSVTKKWQGLAEELFADSHVLEIDFPADTALQYKAAIIGFCIIIMQEVNVHYEYRR